MVHDEAVAESPGGGMNMDAGQSEAIDALAGALAKAQGAMRSAVKDNENPHFRSKYATLASVWDACRGPLSANGLAVMQRVRTTDTSVVVSTMLVHSSGQWVSDSCTMPVAQKTPQAFGSALTYAKRYTLSALVGVASDDDDDGNEASGFSVKPVKPQMQNGPSAAKAAVSRRAEAPTSTQPTSTQPTSTQPAAEGQKAPIIVDVKAGETEDAATARAKAALAAQGIELTQEPKKAKWSDKAEGDLAAMAMDLEEWLGKYPEHKQAPETRARLHAIQAELAKRHAEVEAP